MSSPTTNNKWNSKFYDMKYFIITNSAVVGVLKETDTQMIGYVISGKAANPVDTKVRMDKAKVLRSISDGKVILVEEIVNWMEEGAVVDGYEQKILDELEQRDDDNDTPDNNDGLEAA